MRTLYMVCFDVSDPRRLRRVADELLNFGMRVQRSVFECWLDTGEYFELKSQLARHLDTREDRVRYYAICPADAKGILVDGPGAVTQDTAYTIV